jgi:hypothetical protein
MVGGGVGDGTTTFGRLAATIPARRSDEAVERLIHLYQDQRSPDESPLTFFRRVDVAVVKSTLAGLDKLEPETATIEDFTDLAEDHAFRPEIQEGECAHSTPSRHRPPDRNRCSTLSGARRSCGCAGSCPATRASKCTRRESSRTPADR